MESSPKIYVYKLTADNGGAPCVQDNLLSLAICKPMIRKKAKEGALIFGFGAKNYSERLIYNAHVLLSDDFRYFGGDGSDDYKADFPAIRYLIENLGQGHRVNHEPNLFEELLRLKAHVWSEWPANLANRPSESDFTMTCNQDAGSCGVTRAKTES